MNASQRIVLNTAATYGRSLVAVGLALFSSRWVLGALGQSDFGLFAVVGSLIVMITFINGVMSVSAARHFSFSIGQGNTEDVVRWFNASMGIHLLMPIILILIGWPIGEYCIRHVLVMPPDRMDACLFVFRVSLAASFTGMVSVPFIAMFSAKQRLTEPAFWGLIHSVGMFLLALSLSRIGGDSLRVYAVGMVGITMLGHIIQVIRSHHLFPECRVVPSYWFDRSRLRGIASFASWSLMGNLGGTVSIQMPSFLLNSYFGPTMNAAYGIASRVSIQTASLTTAMMGAMSPEIIASEGRGDRPRVMELTLRTCKFSAVLIMLFAIPLLFEMEYVLKAWLVVPPEYAATFCRWMLVILLVNKLTIGHMMAVNASGRIAGYQLTLGTINLLSVPLAWLFLKWGGSPPSVCVALFIGCATYSSGRVWWARHLLGLSAWRWVREVLLPTMALFLCSAVVIAIPMGLMGSSFLRLGVVTALAVSTILIGSWGILLDEQEKSFIKLQVSRMRGKLSFLSKKGETGA